MSRARTARRHGSAGAPRAIAGPPVQLDTRPGVVPAHRPEAPRAIAIALLMAVIQVVAFGVVLLRVF